MNKQQTKRIFKAPFIFIISVLLPFFGYTQLPTQTIRGTIKTAVNNSPLAGATVSIIDLEPTMGTTTDENGAFRIESVPIGRHQLQVQYLGYETLIISEVLVESGKENIQNIFLQEANEQLGEIIVKADRSQYKSHIPASIETITVEETLRYPATFFDPARLATSFAGVAGDNDQANNVVIRGNSPNSMKWRLEGVEIVNPNHTNNAGTFNDRPTQSGGGVNILSAQLLGTTSFLTGAFPSEYGNAIGGVMDMNFRKGNDEQHEFVAQVGLIGIELAAEGPFSKDSKASYLVNYRYSTIGLLSSLGVPLGDEEINFQDLAFNINIPTKLGGRITLFGMGGLSENIFEADRDSTTWEFSKDRFDIRFESEMGAVGGTYTQPIGEQTIWRSVLALSALETTRRSDRLDDELVATNFDNDKLTQRKLSFSSQFQHTINNRNQLNVGVLLTDINDAYSFNRLNGLTDGGEGGGLLFQPHIRWQFKLSNQLSLNAGLHYNHYAFNNSNSLEPRASIRLALPAQQRLSFAYGLHSQIQAPQVYFTKVDGRTLNEDLGMTRSHHFVLSYQKQTKNLGKLKAELYYQNLFDVPVLDINSSVVGTNQNIGISFSALNVLDDFIQAPLINQGTGKNYGVELSWQKYLTNDFYYLVNGTFYESKYTGADRIERDTRFNGNYIFNATAGKEWKWDKLDKNRGVILGVNARFVYLGGFKDTPIDVAASRAAQQTIYKIDEAFTIDQKDYYKLDLRVYWKRNKTRYNTMLALDIQNVTNAENIAYSYYDTQQETIVEKNQLGLIPILTYRVEF